MHGFRNVSVCRGKRLLLLEVDVIDEFHGDRHDRKPCNKQQDIQRLELCRGFVGLHGGGFHIAGRAQRQRHDGGADALREIAEEGIDRVKRPLLAHALFAVAHFNAVGDDRPHDDLEHAAADVDKHQPGDIQHHAFCVGRDGQEQHQNTRKHTAQAPENDEPLFADLADDRRGERHERQQRYIGGDHGERRFFRIMEIKLEYQVVDRSGGIVKRHNSEGRDSDGEQRAVREKGLDRGKIADLFYAFLANDTFRHHFAKQDKHKKGHHGKYDSHEEHPAFRKHVIHIHDLRKQHDENSCNTRTDAAEGGKRGALLRVFGDDGVQGTVWNIDHGVSGRIQPVDQKAPDRLAGLRELLHGQKQKDRKSQKPHRTDGDPRHELAFFTEPVPIYHAADDNVVDRIPDFRYHNDPCPILGRQPDALRVKQEHVRRNQLEREVAAEIPHGVPDLIARPERAQLLCRLHRQSSFPSGSAEMYLIGVFPKDTRSGVQCAEKSSQSAKSAVDLNILYRIYNFILQELGNNVKYNVCVRAKSAKKPPERAA